MSASKDIRKGGRIAVGAVVLVTIAGVSRPVPAACVRGRYRFVVESVEPRSRDVSLGMRIDVGPQKTALAVTDCMPAAMDFIETPQGATVKAPKILCKKGKVKFSLDAHIEGPACVILSGVLRVGPKEQVRIRARLRECNGDPEVTHADITAAVNAMNGEELRDGWHDPDAFVTMVQKIQAQLGCHLLSAVVASHDKTPKSTPTP